MNGDEIPLPLRMKRNGDPAWSRGEKFSAIVWAIFGITAGVVIVWALFFYP